MEEEKEDITELTDKQKRFCYEYCVDLNGTQAAIRAGYSEKTAAVIASQNLIKVNIQKEIKRLQDNLEETAGLTKLRILNEHMKLAFSSIANLHNTWMTRKDFEDLTEDQKACIEEISTQIKVGRNVNGQLTENEYVKIKLYDKQKALDSISKMLGYDAPVKMQVGLDVTDMPDIIIRTE